MKINGCDHKLAESAWENKTNQKNSVTCVHTTLP